MAVGLEVAMVEAKAAAVMEVVLGLVGKEEAEREGVGKVEVAMEAEAMAEAGCTRRLEQVAAGVAVMEAAASVGVTEVEAMAEAPAAVRAVEAEEVEREVGVMVEAGREAAATAAAVKAGT